MAKLLINSNGKVLMNENGKIYKAPTSSSSSSSSLKKLLDTTKSAYHLFYEYIGTSIDGSIQYSDTENVTNMREMFMSCKNLTTIPKLNTSNVTIMDSMFRKCQKLQTIPQLDTSKVINLASMFDGCNNLQTIPQLDTSNTFYTDYMFLNCHLLSKIDLTSLDNVMSSSTNFAAFYNCYSLTKLIIRTMTKIPGLNSNTFSGCYHFTGTVNADYNPQGLKDGRIYVPDDKVEELKSATNWSAFADCIVPLSTLEE